VTSATSSGAEAEAGELSTSTVKVTFEDGIAWVVLNRPEKRNAMNPAMNRDMNVILDALEIDDRCKVLVLTGAGDAFTAGMDLREFFRETAGFDPIKRRRTMAQATNWQWRKLRYFAKPTIAMVNGWTFGGVSSRSSRATSRSPPTTRHSAFRRSTGASSRPVTSPRRSKPCSTNARHCATS